MLGHKHITTTQIYAKITNDKIGRDMDMLTEKIADKFRMAQ
jgi:site-specific recombinase xerD